MKKLAYRLWQIVWGFPQTFAGFVIYLAYARWPHFGYHGALVTVWPQASSVSLGMFIFVSQEAGRAKATTRRTSAPHAGEDPAFDKVLVHEYGHTVQSLVLGPLYLLVVGLPSVLWGYLPRNRRKRAATGISYYQFVTERSANHLGELVCKQAAPR